MLIEKHKSNTGNLSAKKNSNAKKMWINYIHTKHYLAEKEQLNGQQRKR